MALPALFKRDNVFYRSLLGWQAVTGSLVRNAGFTATCRRTQIDLRRSRFDASQDELVRYLEAQSSSAERSNKELSLEDDRLRLIFTCCHPALPQEGQVALT